MQRVSRIFYDTVWLKLIRKLGVVAKKSGRSLQQKASDNTKRARTLLERGAGIYGTRFCCTGCSLRWVLQLMQFPEHHPVEIASIFLFQEILKKEKKPIR